jgi:hypothetical protein
MRTTTLKELFDELNELCTVYSELLVEDMPDRSIRLRPNTPTAIRVVEPNRSYEYEGGGISFKVQDVESGVICSGVVPLKSVTYRLTFNAFAGTWLLSYYPIDHPGFEIRGANLRHVVVMGIRTFEKNIAFLFGDAHEWLLDADEECQQFIVNRAKTDIGDTWV